VFALITGVGTATAVTAFRVDWRRTYAVSKAVASLGFIGTALTAGALGAGWSRLALGALILSAVGDVALATRGKRGFIVGLLCFAAAHSVYATAFWVYGTEGTTALITSCLVAMVAGGGWIVFHRRLPGAMRTPVGVYLIILSAMLAAGVAAGITQRSTLLVCGVVLVAGSDIAVARERFGTSMFANKLIGLPTYYVGQTLIALSLAGS
jgi:uncharacterized membrane protein YhhN